MKTPGGPSAQTMEVINSTIDIENEINALLNRFTFPVLDWDWSTEITWYPGDPMYPAPIKQEGCGGECCPDYYITEGGQHVRPIFELFDDDEDFGRDELFMDCTDCEVGGGSEDKECWMCGKELAGLWRPSSWNVWVNPTQAEAYWANAWGEEGLTPSSVMRYEYGDAIEDFDSGAWTAANENLRFIRDIVPELQPWQERVVYQGMQSGGNIDENGITRLWMSFPQRNSGRRYLESLVATYFEGGKLIDMETPIPTNVQIQESRRAPQVQNNYPTSGNPTQERRRRNH